MGEPAAPVLRWDPGPPTALNSWIVATRYSSCINPGVHSPCGSQANPGRTNPNCHLRRPRQREAKTPLMQLFLLATLSFFAAFSPTSTMTRSHWTSRSANASLAPLPFHVMTIIMLPVFSYSKLLTMVVELLLERKQAAASSRTTTSQISPPPALAYLHQNREQYFTAQL